MLVTNTQAAIKIEAYSKAEHPSGCWVWQGSKSGRYGGVRIDGKYLKAHRVSYETYIGKIPKGKFVLHKCDAPLCVNPDHLFIGTQSDNMKDCVVKGRHHDMPGEENPHSKLTAKDVLTIVDRSRNGCEKKKLAKIFGVSVDAIYAINSGRTWSWLTGLNQATEPRRK